MSRTIKEIVDELHQACIDKEQPVLLFVGTESNMQIGLIKGQEQELLDMINTSAQREPSIKSFLNSLLFELAKRKVSVLLGGMNDDNEEPKDTTPMPPKAEC